MTNPPADEPISRYFTSETLKLHYADWGNESAPPLLLIHGTRDHARSWDWTARALRDRWHVMAVDLRGHGDSAWSPDGAYLMHYHILDLCALVESLGQPQLDIVAHSFGGNFAARYAGLFPGKVRKLALVDSIGPTPENYERWEKEGPVTRSRQFIEQRRDPRQLNPRHFATIEEGAARMARTNPRLSPEQAYHLAKHGVRRYEDGYGWKFDPRVSMFLPEDFAIYGAPYWKEITAPVLLIHGKQSWTTNYEEDGRAACFQNQRTISFDDAGHWIHHDRLDGFIAALEEFL